jgi:hypothetical protein
MERDNRGPGAIVAIVEPLIGSARAMDDLIYC